MLRVGFDVGGTTIKVGIIREEDCKMLSYRKIPFPKDEGYEWVTALMAGLVLEMTEELQTDVSACRTIGIAIPGSIDSSENTILHAHNLGFHHVPFKSAMEAHFPGVRVYLANDGNTAALAELHMGAFKGCKTAVLLTLGTGVGGGLILDGRMFNGGRNHGVELGHMIISREGPECTCGNRGCMEALCAATWLVQQGKKAAGEGRSRAIMEKVNGRLGGITAKVVMDSAKEGNEASLEIFDRYVDSLSTAIASCINLLDPEVIALGGGVSHAGDFLFEPLRALVRKKSFFKVDYKIVPAELGNDAGILGAAMLHRND